MKKIVNLLIFLIITTGSVFFVYYRGTAICRSPLDYTIGVVDERFGISRDKFVGRIKEAEAVWEGGFNREFFNYKPDASFKINLVFDERQKETIEAKQSETNIEISRSMYDRILAEYNQQAAIYQSRLDSYNNLVDEFEKRLGIYNAEVAKINARGGATPKEHGELEAERKYLESQKKLLDNLRGELSKLVSQVNSLGEQVNYLAGQLNIDVDIFNKRFGEAREFDQGEYNGKEINIYQFDEAWDLRLVLAHELGHALGIEHVENPKSIMYYLMDKQDTKNPVLSPEDKKAFIERCSPGHLFKFLRSVYRS
ncbi:MAG: matrixin family metalloprotease [Candidatus Yanofskybacteria bacterium]|nr:matrixin family metalloprotease [Candidatus Yanofskybacteria bacterium]